MYGLLSPGVTFTRRNTKYGSCGGPGNDVNRSTHSIQSYVSFDIPCNPYLDERHMTQPQHETKRSTIRTALRLCVFATTAILLLNHTGSLFSFKPKSSVVSSESQHQNQYQTVPSSGAAKGTMSGMRNVGYFVCLRNATDLVDDALTPGQLVRCFHPDHLTSGASTAGNTLPRRSRAIFSPTSITHSPM